MSAEVTIRIISATGIKHLHLSATTLRTLKTCGIETVGELVEHTESELIGAGLSEKNVANVKKCLDLVHMTLSNPKVAKVKTETEIHIP